MKLSHFTPKQLLELDACTRCGECLHYCPVFAQQKEEGINPRGKIQAMKKFIRSQFGLWAKWFGPKKLDEQTLKKFSEMVFRCTLCGECSVACPISIDSRNLWTSFRECLMEMGYSPPSLELLKKNLLETHNISGMNNQERNDWIQALGDLPPHLYQKEKAEVVFFVGCVASFYPMVHKIPQTLVKIFVKAGVDFALLGGEEWCCGFPLISAGYKKEIKGLIEHHLEGVKKRGARSVVFTCPSCYHTWKHHYRSDLQLYHFTQFCLELVKEGKITFKGERIKVTYHDPCDLGRGSGIYEAPRELLRAIPGVELVELADHGEHCKCCGGGGLLEMVDPDLQMALAKEKIKQIQDTQADLMITTCQQCLRTIVSTARKMKIPLKGAYLTEFILKQMN